MLGSSLVQYAIMWYITLETKSGIMMTISIICGFLPMFFLSPFAGVWADRYDRKRLILLADGAIALASLGAALVFSLGYRSVWLLFAVMALRAVGQAIQGPAVGAFFPQIVPEDKLTRVNGINGSIQSLIMILSPILSGLLLTMGPIQRIFLIDVGTAIPAMLILAFFLRVPVHAKALAPQTVSYFHDMRLGFRYIRDHRFLVSFFVYVGIFFFMVTPAAFLTPLLTARTFGAEVWRLTAIEIVFSVGMMLGGALIATWGGFKNRMRTMVASNVVMAICTIALGLAPVFWLYLLVMGIFGVSMPLYNTSSAVMIQEHVDQDYMGRVYSVLAMLSTSLMPLGMLIFGPLADIVRIETLLIITGAIMLVHGARVFWDRTLMAAGVPKSAETATQKYSK